MKNISKIYIILLIFFGFAGCNDKLNVEPYTFVTDGTFYKTEDQIKSAVNGVYATLKNLYNGGDGSLFALTELRADNTDYQWYETDRGIQQREDINDFLMTASNVYNQMTWNNLYNAIQQANAVIGHINDVTYSSPATKAQYEGEVRFIRALMYFHLVRLYGQVPLRQLATTGPGDAFTKEKATVEQLYSFILEDVKFATENLSAKDKLAAADKGRATQGAAFTLQGEIYLTRKEYANAITSLQKVTGYSLLLGLDGYAKIFDPAYKNNDESVFEIQYSASLNQASNYIYSWGPRDSRPKLTGFNGALSASNTPTTDIIEAYEKGDLRKDVSIAYFVDPVNMNYQESLGKNMDSAVFINKFYHAGTYTVNGRSDENWPVYRFAYVKLMLAEALNEDGRGSEALPLLNEVRSRAGLGAFTSTDQGQLREAIFKEIRVEVAFENHRWYQLLRTGRAVDIMTEHGKKEKTRLADAASRMTPKRNSHLADEAYDIKPYKLLFPLPERECRLNGFSNNPEWY